MSDVEFNDQNNSKRHNVELLPKKGIIGWLINKGIVKSIAQANLLLISVFILLIMFSFMHSYFSGRIKNYVDPKHPPTYKK